MGIRFSLFESQIRINRYVKYSFLLKISTIRSRSSLSSSYFSLFLKLCEYKKERKEDVFHDYKYIYVRLTRMVVSNYTNVTKRKKKKERGTQSRRKVLNTIYDRAPAADQASKGASIPSFRNEFVKDLFIVWIRSCRVEAARGGSRERGPRYL